MGKIKIFISSVQTEFAKERQELFDYLIQDALLGLFFHPFIFENISASNQSPKDTYLEEVNKCDIYLGLFGKDYGYKDVNGVSPTEKEYDLATKENKFRLIFISKYKIEEIDSKELTLIRKVEKEVIRKKFTSINELKTNLYSSLISYLEENEYIHTSPFDTTINKDANFDDIDNDKVIEWVEIARTKRGFPLTAQKPIKDIFIQLNLIKNNKLTNASLLLFGKEPQKFFINSEVKCAQFHGIKIEKPIPSYQVYKGDVFSLINKTVNFVLSRIDISTGTRNKSNQVDIEYEIPREVIAEAVVNAIVHRDYTSNGSVQIMLFKDRLEIWNPGRLPSNLTIANLREPHSSSPKNLLLADPMYLAGYIERLGTGTNDMITRCNDIGLREIQFVQGDVFKTIIWRNTKQIENDVPINSESVPINSESVPINSGDNKRLINSKIDLSDINNIHILNAINEVTNTKAHTLGNNVILKEKQLLIIQKIAKNKTITQKELADILRVSERQIKRQIKKLKDIDLLERVGSNKKGYWLIKRKFK